MENENYTIKDIARMAGVSAGTVDRVLHNRGNVSEASREKVQSVLGRINYQPNMFAIGLAAKKHYRIVCLLPYCMEHDYWYAVMQGVERAAQELQPFNVEVGSLCYKHGDRESYREACERLLNSRQDAVLIAPNFEDETLRLTTCLDADAVPYAFIDFNMEQMHALCYIGQDSRVSGYVAAKILMQRFEQGDELVVFLSNQRNSPAEVQMRRRMEGFMEYIGEKFEQIRVFDVVLQKEDADENKKILEDFFSKHPRATLGAVFNSRVYQVAGYLHETKRKLKGLLGYDLLQKNVDYLKLGEVSCLIGQRPSLQGYLGVKALCDIVVFKKKVEAVKYMPIDILIKETINYYFEFDKSNP